MKIKLGKSILVHFHRQGEVSLLHPKTELFWEYAGLEAKVIRVLAERDEQPVTALPQILPELRRLSRDEEISEKRVLAVLETLSAEGILEGLPKSRRKGRSKKRSSGSMLLARSGRDLALGAFSLGAGLMLSPEPAHAINCIGPPSCTNMGRACVYVPGFFWICEIYPGAGYGDPCDAGCS